MQKAEREQLGGGAQANMCVAPEAQSSMPQQQSAQRQYMQSLAGPQQKGKAEAAPAAPENKAAKLSKMSVGNVTDLGGGFSRKVGALIDVLIPKDGDCGAIQVDANLPIPPIGANLAITMKAEVERMNAASGKSKVRVRSELAIGVSKKIDAVFMEAYAKVQLLGYTESLGDTSEEALRLITLGIYERLHGSFPGPAEALMDPRAAKATVAGMDEEDYSETGAGVSASASLKLGHGEHGKEMGGSAQFTQGTRLHNEKGELKGRPIRAFKYGVSAGHIAGSLEGSCEHENGQITLAEARISAGAKMSLAHLSVEGKVAEALGALFGEACQAGRLGKALNSDSAGRKLGAGIDLVGKSGCARLTGHLVNEQLTKRVHGWEGVEVGVKFIGMVRYDAGKWVGRLQVCRTQEIQLGGSEADTVHLLLENSESVIDTGEFVAAGGGHAEPGGEG
jgi:hypothetical protein